MHWYLCQLECIFVCAFREEMTTLLVGCIYFLMCHWLDGPFDGSSLHCFIQGLQRERVRYSCMITLSLNGQICRWSLQEKSYISAFIALSSLLTKCGQAIEVSVTEQILRIFPNYRKPWAPEHVLYIQDHFWSLLFAQEARNETWTRSFFVTKLY